MVSSACHRTSPRTRSSIASRNSFPQSMRAASLPSRRGRPVAALATETRFHGDAIPGRTLELAVDIDDCDDDAVAYSGSASVDGKTIIELTHCLGPMLPVADFDEPDALRQRFALLRTIGASPHRFEGVTLPTVVTREHVPGHALKATLPVPPDAPFFGDHFPRRAV